MTSSNHCTDSVPRRYAEQNSQSRILRTRCNRTVTFRVGTRAKRPFLGAHRTKEERTWRECDLRLYGRHRGVEETYDVTSLQPPNLESWLPGQFPEELEADVEIAGGATLRLRPIRCSDDERLVEFHTHLSFDSIYRRYFSLHPVLSTTEVKHFTQVDYVNRLAFVVEDGDALVAVGRYDRYPESTTAEVAFVVRDDYQHLGLGHRLLDALAAAAWERGITEFSAETLSSNRSMLSVFRHSGFAVSTTSEFNETSVRFSIDPQKSVVAQLR